MRISSSGIRRRSGGSRRTSSTSCRATSCRAPRWSPGPVTGGALLAHTIAGLLDSRRSLTHPPCSFAPFNYDPAGGFTLRAFYARELAGKRVLLADDVRNTGETFARCAALVNEAGGTVLATVEIYDRLEAVADAGAPNFALAEYKAPENFKAAACPLCARRFPSRGSERPVGRLRGTCHVRRQGRSSTLFRQSLAAANWKRSQPQTRLQQDNHNRAGKAEPQHSELDDPKEPSEAWSSTG